MHFVSSRTMRIKCGKKYSDNISLGELLAMALYWLVVEYCKIQQTEFRNPPHTMNEHQCSQRSSQPIAPLEPAERAPLSGQHSANI